MNSNSLFAISATKAISASRSSVSSSCSLRELIDVPETSQTSSEKRFAAVRNRSTISRRARFNFFDNAPNAAPSFPVPSARTALQHIHSARVFLERMSRPCVADDALAAAPEPRRSAISFSEAPASVAGPTHFFWIRSQTLPTSTCHLSSSSRNDAMSAADTHTTVPRSNTLTPFGRVVFSGSVSFSFPFLWKGLEFSSYSFSSVRVSTGASNASAMRFSACIGTTSSGVRSSFRACAFATEVAT
mmetsp:Transcript_11494/g.38001  ORF Transcript_11494/g.38001 Transcript_11494/m.38001 type:complete len:245 (-) Transcript_11494:508-1242(-)